jgi:uncharacterized membrane protein SpoIIM required for sporulation
MLVEDFIQMRRASWERLTELIARAQGVSLHGLSAEELQELGRLYRLSTSDLAVARRDFPSHQVAGYLNDLVARGHGVVYREGGTRGQQILAFFSALVPRTFRATWPFTAVSALMFFLPALLSFVLVWGEAVEPTTLVPGIDSALRQIRDGEEWWLRINEEGRAASSSFIMTNNIRVAFLAFAGGMLLGLFTVWILIQNGLLLGTLSGAALLADFADNLWGFVTAHAPVELSVICIAGGAGLQMGWAIFRPGLLARSAALMLAARRALILIGGCVPLLVLAGTIEGFVSPAPLPYAVKLATALLSGGTMFAWLLLAGRKARS